MENFAALFLMSEKVQLAIIGLLGLVVSQAGLCLQMWLGHRQINRKLDEAKDSADAAYREANGYNRKLSMIAESKAATVGK